MTVPLIATPSPSLSRRAVLVSGHAPLRTLLTFPIPVFTSRLEGNVMGCDSPRCAFGSARHAAPVCKDDICCQ